MTGSTTRSTGPAWVAIALASVILLTLANGKYSNPWAAWIAPALFVRIVRDLPRRRAIAFAYVGCWLSCAVQWRIVFPIQGPLFYVISLLLCLVPFVPYLVDRVSAPRLGGLRGTLVLPAAAVVVEFLFANLSPYGAWGSLAYSQASVLVVAQLASVVGMYGITFLILWTATIANLVVEDRRASRRVHVPALAILATVFAAVVLFGAVRLGGPAPTSSSLRIATISPRTDDDASYRIPRAIELQDSLLTWSRDAVRAGAELVVWPEGSFSIFAADESAWLERASAFASEEGAYLAAPYATRVSEADPRFENKMVLVGPDGSILWTYVKSRPVPGMEDLAIPGSGDVARGELAGVRVAGMICFDADHPDLIRQVGGTADLVLVPSDDWKEIVTLHAAMVRIRAIEWGVPIVRSTLHGASIAYDRQGRVLGSQRDDGAPGSTLILDVAPGGVDTPYGRFPDRFVWLCAIAWALLSIASARRASGASTRP